MRKQRFSYEEVYLISIKKTKSIKINLKVVCNYLVLKHNNGSNIGNTVARSNLCYKIEE